MKRTNALVIGASVSGLAAAASLQKERIEYIIIEKEATVAAPWRNHYDRLHLHTNKGLSNLPYKKFGRSIPRYPSRQQVINYLEEYQREFGIAPVFNTEAISIRRVGNYWITETNHDVFESKYLIMATGAFGKPKTVYFKGMETFPGNILHSYGYKTGSDYKGQKVLVVGFGNSACEIAIDLYEQGAMPYMAVRSPVNIVPRDLLGIPILRISTFMSRLPVRIADAIVGRITRIKFGNISQLGLRKKLYGPFTQMSKEGNTPVLDIGTIKHIRAGHINIYVDIDHIENRTVYFADGRKENFDAMIAAIGYYRDYVNIPDVDKNRVEDLKLRTSKQKYFGKDGLYFCGFRFGPTGVIHEISSDAKKIARDIAKNCF